MGEFRGIGWFNPLADFLGTAYLRNAFTYGTKQEVDFIVDSFGLKPGMRVLDVGCGPGRHSLELARRGISAHGIDLSETFIDLARKSARSEALDATFEVGDINELDIDGEFDALICLCQGGFGLLGGAEDAVLVSRLVKALKTGGRVALSAFSSYFAVRWLETNDNFNLVSGVNHERATLRNADGAEEEFDLWTTCFTARELRLLARGSDLEVDAIHGVTPGDYGPHAVTLDRPELLLLGTRILGC